jgi:predicted TIM-barrel fold metal-dependent hydrolase
VRTIALEEHFLTSSFQTATQSFFENGPERMRQLQAKLLDIGDGRIASMDEAGIDVQVLSLAANGFEQLGIGVAAPLARDINDELAAAIAKHPDRLRGFATLALKNAETASVELERCVTKLGFCGAMVNGLTDGEFLDQPRFLPVFEAAQALGVPIYVHPAEPPASVKEAYFSGLSEEASFLLSIAGWGWHAELGLHVLRLIVSGLFEKLPDLQVIIGHMGEGVPYALARSSSVLSGTMKQPSLSVADYFKRNIYVTTSGYFTKPPFQCAVDVLGIDRLMFSVDYPFSDNMKGRNFLNSLDLYPEDLAKVTHRNAERVLKI